MAYPLTHTHTHTPTHKTNKIKKECHSRKSRQENVRGELLISNDETKPAAKPEATGRKADRNMSGPGNGKVSDNRHSGEKSKTICIVNNAMKREIVIFIMHGNQFACHTNQPFFGNHFRQKQQQHWANEAMILYAMITKFWQCCGGGWRGRMRRKSHGSKDMKKL